MPSQVGYFDTLKSAAGKVLTYLASITITGTDGKTLTVTNDATISETPPLNANVIKGDGVAGRVLRVGNIRIEDATDAAHIKCSTTSLWNGDANTAQDNIGKDEVTTGVWNLSLNGSVLYLVDSGITGTLIAVLSMLIRSNSSGTDILVTGQATAGWLYLGFTNSTTGAPVDLTTLVDTGSIQLQWTYVTS